MVMAVWKYDLDLTGTSPNNSVIGEIHNVPLKDTRAFATNYGPFYSASVQVTVVETGQVLTQGTDYECLFLYSEATAQSGKTVTAVIHILNASVDGDVSVDYQVVGGQYSSNAYALEELIAMLGIDNRAISWENVLNKPLAFPPEPHLHAATDLYGFEYLVEAVNDLTQALLLGDTASHDQIYLRIATASKLLQDQIDQNKKDSEDRDAAIRTDMDAMDTRLTAAINAVSSALNAHVNNKNNPHGVTVDQIGAVPTSRTVNGKPLTGNIVISAGDTGAYSKSEIDTKVTALQNSDTQLQNNINAVNSALTAHINNRSNPHGVSVGQIGAVPTSRTVNGQSLANNVSLSAGSVGTYDAGTIDAKIAAAAGNAGRLQWGASQTFKERGLNERLGSAAMTGWADYGGSNYWVRLRPLYYLSNGQWVLTPYT